AACCDCTTSNCSLAPAPGGTDGCSSITNPADRALCQAAATCFQTSNCTNAGDANPCFCGTNPTTCFTAQPGMPGAANGVCVAQAQAAAKTMDPTLIKPQFVSPTSPLGRAVNLVGCQGSFCADPTICNIP